MLIGELTGDVSTSRMTFEAYKEVEQFDFVTVKNPKDGQDWILAQIDEVTKSPDGETTCEAEIIGFREDGMLKQPRYVIEPDSMVYRADEDVIAETLGLTTDGLYMGRLETNPSISIYLDPEDLYTHIAVLAKTGAGKSYATGVMVEELLEADYPVLIVDPHGEFNTLQHANDLSDEERDAYDIEEKGYPVKEYSIDTGVNPGTEKLRFASNGLGASEVEQLVPTNLTNSQLEVLYNALKDLEDRDSYDLDDIVDACQRQESKAKWNLVNILEVVQDSALFGHDPTGLEGLIEPGTATLVNLKGVDPDQQEMAVYLLARELFQRRKVGELQPFIMLLEEAHNFVPERNFGKAVCSDVLRTVASEGRKFGMGLGVISQRPARVDKNILSQCNTQLILRVTNPNDLNAISRSFEGVTSEVKEYLTALPPGTGLLLGKEYPVMTDIRTRRSRHGGGMNELSAAEADAAATGAEPAPVSDDGPEDSQGDGQAPDTATPAQPPAAATATTAQRQDDDGAQPDTDDADAREDDGVAGTDDGQDALPAPDEDGTDDPAALAPVLDREKLAEQVGDVQTAYYPLWVVRAGDDAVAVDGKDGSVKAAAAGLDGVARDVLQLVEREPRTTGTLVEALDASLATVQDAVATLEERGLIAAAEDGDRTRYRATGSRLLDGERKRLNGDGAVIEPDVAAEDAVDQAAELLGEPGGAELVYHPYFTAGDRVFDAVQATEV